MAHPKTVKFDDRMRKLLEEVDSYIEDIYGDRFTLNPVRPARGETASGEMDGLFSIIADFTPGYGSELGRGYFIDLSISTLDKVSEDQRSEIYETAVGKVKELLPLHFPERELAVQRDRNHYKILGDFSLGEIY
jgi:hypothetical protein